MKPRQPHQREGESELYRPALASAFLGCSRSKLYHLSETDPDFPTKIRLSARHVGWRRRDLEAYLELKAEKARKGVA